MAKSFSTTQGKAKSSGNTYKYTDGEQSLRFVGDILPRYVYWIDNKVPFDCLRFDREEERWVSGEDPVQLAWPDAKGSWSYITRAFGSDGKLYEVNLKKKMFEAMQQLAVDNSSMFDEDEGYPIIFEKKKNGPLAFNVDYSLNIVKILKAGKAPLTAEQKEILANAEPLEKLYPMPTLAQQTEAVRKYKDKSDSVDSSVKKEFDTE